MLFAMCYTNFFGFSLPGGGQQWRSRDTLSCIQAKRFSESDSTSWWHPWTSWRPQCCKFHLQRIENMLSEYLTVFWFGCAFKIKLNSGKVSNLHIWESSYDKQNGCNDYIHSDCCLLTVCFKFSARSEQTVRCWWVFCHTYDIAVHYYLFSQKPLRERLGQVQTVKSWDENNPRSIWTSEQFKFQMDLDFCWAVGTLLWIKSAYLPNILGQCRQMCTTCED